MHFSFRDYIVDVKLIEANKEYKMPVMFVSDHMIAFLCLCLEVYCGNEFGRGMCFLTELLPCHAMACVWYCLVGCRVDNPSVPTGLRSIPDQ
jgi:hypothetical protein